MIPLLQSLGKTSLSHILGKRPVRTTEAVKISAFNSSARDESIPGAFPFFITFIAVSTTAWEGGLVLMAMSFD